MIFYEMRGVLNWNPAPKKRLCLRQAAHGAGLNETENAEEDILLLLTTRHFRHFASASVALQSRFSATAARCSLPLKGGSPAGSAIAPGTSRSEAMDLLTCRLARQGLAKAAAFFAVHGHIKV